jgi:diadenylate cyclase
MWQSITGSIVVDVLDILIVAWLLYRLVLLIRGTRALQMFTGLGVLLLASFIAASLGMIVVKRVTETLQTVWVVAFIILFQPELRAALMQIGRKRGLKLFGGPEEIPAEREILNAVERLARRGLGALIVIERGIGLDRWIRTGTVLNAEIKAETIEAIFTVPGPLHDGAIIISQGKIAAAACILPNAEREELAYVLGTRHRAAIGMSEVSDAFVIVVSEETRAVSLAFGGEIRRGLSLEDLTTELNRILSTTGRGMGRGDRESGKSQAGRASTA